MNFIDDSAFLTTFGREFSSALNAVPNFEPLDDPTSHDCYSVFTETTGNPPTPEFLEKLSRDDFEKLARGFNEFFEVDSVTAEPLEQARDSVLKHWEP